MLWSRFKIKATLVNVSKDVPWTKEAPLYFLNLNFYIQKTQAKFKEDSCTLINNNSDTTR